MSQDDKEIEALNKIFSRASREPEFRNKLLNEPETVLGELEISDRAKDMITKTIKGMEQ